MLIIRLLMAFGRRHFEKACTKVWTKNYFRIKRNYLVKIRSWITYNHTESGFRCSRNDGPPVIWVISLCLWYQVYLVIIIVQLFCYCSKHYIFKNYFLMVNCPFSYYYIYSLFDNPRLSLVFDQKGVSSFPSTHYLWTVLGPISLPCGQK